MNILIVHNHYRISGGEDTVVKNEYELLKSMGHDVALYTRHNDEIGGLSAFQRLMLPLTFIYSKKTAKDIGELIKERKIDVIMVHNTLSLISPSVYYAAVKNGVPVIQTIHNFRLICPKATLYRDGQICEDCVKKGLHCALMHRCYRGSFIQTLICVIGSKIHRRTGIYGKINYICLTEFNKAKLLTHPGIKKDSIYVKPNFTKKPEKILPYGDRDNTFIYAGRLEEQKGTKELLDAWYMLETKAESQEAVPLLEIYGTGPMSEYCRKYIEKHGLKNVQMHDPLPHEEIMEKIAGAKAMILPTKWYEGFPMTIAEAFSVGTPVIGTDIGNTGDLIGGRYGNENKDREGSYKGDSSKSAHFTKLGALIDSEDIEGSLARIITDWDSFRYDEAAFDMAAKAYGEEENKRIFEGIFHKVVKE